MRFNGLPTFVDQEYGSFNSNHGLPVNTPALDADLPSPMSLAGCVDPSQTTFDNMFEMQSPMRSLHFNSPNSEYHPNFAVGHSPMDNMVINLHYDDSKSASTTPSRAPTNFCRASIPRQPLSSIAGTSAALQQIQSATHEGRDKAKRGRRNLVRGARRPHHAEIQLASRHYCSWPDCTRAFVRSEHLKRHERTHKPGLLPPEICPSCGHVFKGARADNLKTHMKLHMEGSKRTKKDERVAPLLEEMDRDRGKKKHKPRGERQLKEGVKMHDMPVRTGLRVLEY